MKLNTLLVAGAVSLGLASMASAQNRVYITGSTAFRPGMYDAISSLYDSSPAVQIAAYKTSGASPTDPHSAGLMEFDGNIGGARYIIKCGWSGSEAGIKDLATASKTEAFIDDIGVNGVQAITSTTTPSTTDSHTVDLAMADNSQANSLTKTPALTGTTVGIIPFVWVKNAQGHPYSPGTFPNYDRLVNVTHPQLRVTLTGGTKLALITGNTNDTNFVYVAGRDNQSGTRVNTFADTGYGVTKTARQLIITGANGSPSTGSSLSTTGQGSGGTLATTMTFSGSATAPDGINGGTGWFAIAYLGLYDADVALAPNTGDCIALTLNGVAESPTAIEQGQYSFWGQEHIYQNGTFTISSAATTVYNTLTTGGKIDAALDGIHEIRLGSMQAGKTTDLSDPTHN